MLEAIGTTHPGCRGPCTELAHHRNWLQVARRTMGASESQQVSAQPSSQLAVAEVK
jgi:hypothetical protein